MRSRQTAGHQTGLARFRRSRPAKPCVQPSSEGSCHPRATKGSPDSNKRDTTKSLTTLPVNVARTRQSARRGSSTEVGPPSRDHQRVSRRGNWEGVFRLLIGPWNQPASSPKRGSGTRSGPGARQKNSWSTTALPFLKGPRCASPPNTPRREEMASAAAGHRQSQRPSTGRRLSPKEDVPSGRSSPGLTSEEVGPRAIRKPFIRGRHELRHRALPAGVLRPPEAGCRLLTGVRMDPSDLIGSAAPPKQQNRPSQTGLTIRKQAASSARLIGACGLGKAARAGRHHPAEAGWNQPARKPGQNRRSRS